MTILYAVLAVLAVIMVSIFARIDNWQRDWTTNFAKLDAAAKDPELQPVKLDVSPGEAEKRLLEWLEGKPKWSLVSTETSDDGTDMHLTRTTGLFRFTDDIRVQILSDGNGTRIEAESQSRVGKGDLGQNPRNLKELVAGLKSSGATEP